MGSEDKSVHSGRGLPPAEAVRGQHGRCGACRIGIHVVKSPLPAVCPFCQGPLRQKTYHTPPAGDLQVTDDGAELMHRLYRKIPRWFMMLLSAAGVVLLSLVVYFQLSNLEHYWYSPMVNIFSLAVGLFIVSRFIFAAVYSAPPRVGFEPPLTVAIPCFNEEASIAQAIARIFRQDYPAPKMDVVVVNDGSTDRTLEEILRAQALYPRLVVVDFEENRGLAHGMAAAALMARGEFLVYVDSDTFLMPGAVRKVVQGFVDPTVGGIAGHTDVENTGVSVLTRMQDVRYFFSYKIMKAAESVFGMVSCLPGCFSAYRRACLLHVLEEWLYSRCLGREGNYGDDRSLTNLVLRDYRILYDDEAMATTLAPESWRVYSRQQARWMRSYAREVFRASRFIWRKHPVPAISWYAMMWLPLVEPVIILQALVLGPILRGTLAVPYMIGVMAITLVWSLDYLRRTGRPDWWAGFVFTFTYAFFYSWLIYYALATLRHTQWGTRGRS
jgi:hyaluronan synthase